MITLNDYLYSGDTVLKILKKYTEDLRQSAVQTGNEVDVRHCEFLSQIMELLEHNAVSYTHLTLPTNSRV